MSLQIQMKRTGIKSIADLWFRTPVNKGGFALLIFTFQSYINGEYNLLLRI